jgi:hypothetical protein
MRIGGSCEYVDVPIADGVKAGGWEKVGVDGGAGGIETGIEVGG